MELLKAFYKLNEARIHKAILGLALILPSFLAGYALREVKLQNNRLEQQGDLIIGLMEGKLPVITVNDKRIPILEEIDKTLVNFHQRISALEGRPIENFNPFSR